jgi:flagellar hook protein FlgE
MAIQGDGFFVLSDGSRNFFTRDGAFDISLDGTLVNPAIGLKVQGWQADSTGLIDTTTATTSIIIPLGQRTTALATSTADIHGNLDASAVVGGTASTTINVFDTLGNRHSVKVTFTKTAANSWDWAASTDPTDVGTTTSSTGTLDFTSGGVWSAATGSPIVVAFTNGATTPATVPIDFAQMTQYSGASAVSGITNGFTSGSLVTFTIGSGGDITGVYTNGQTQPLGQIALASFLNPGGLSRQGQNLFGVSSASGDAAIGQPGQGGRGSVTTGSLEMSNVDLATQFTGMITAERGFQANGRVITTSDEMLQELVNLKR